MQGHLCLLTPHPSGANTQENAALLPVPTYNPRRTELARPLAHTKRTPEQSLLTCCAQRAGSGPGALAVHPHSPLISLKHPSQSQATEAPSDRTPSLPNSDPAKQQMTGPVGLGRQVSINLSCVFTSRRLSWWLRLQLSGVSI